MIITTRVTDIAPPVASTEPQEAVNLTAVPLVRGVYFHWSLPVYIKPFTWLYRIQVNALGWSDWEPTLYPIVIRGLTELEIGAIPDMTATITIEVKSYYVDPELGDVFSATETTNADTLPLFCSNEDIEDGAVDFPGLAPGCTNLMFTTSAKNLDECTEHGTAHFAGETGADITATHTAADTTLVAGTAAATIKNNAASGALANAKLTTDGVQTGGLTIENTSVGSGSQKRVDDRLSAAEKINLAADKTITGGFSLYHTNNKPTKTDVGLPNVDNLSSAAIRAAIVDADLAGTTAIKTSTLLAAINAITADIVSEAIEDLDAEKVTTDNMGAPTALFDASGNLTFGAVAATKGIKSGASIRTAGNIISVVGSDGLAKNLDFSSLAAGSDLDDIPNGATYSKTTANEKIGAARAFNGLNATFELITGTDVTPVADIDSSVAAGRCIWADQDHSAVPATGTLLASGVSAPATALVRWTYVHRAGEDEIHFSFEALSSTGTTTVWLTMESLAGVLQATGVPVAITSLIYDGVTWTVTLTGLATLLISGNMYKIFLHSGVGGNLSVRGGMMEAFV